MVKKWVETAPEELKERLPADFYSNHGGAWKKEVACYEFTERDGVHGRYYLIHKPDTDSEVLEQADQCIQDVLDGTAEENHSG